MIEYLIELKDYLNYFITESGDVYSDKFDKMRKMKLSVDGRGYLEIQITNKGKRYTKFIHKILAETFINNPDDKKCVDHIDRNKLNNNLNNLRWVTISENMRNQTKHKNNKSGIIGVCFDKSRNRWIAQWYDNEGKTNFKSFLCNKYPNAKQLSIEYRKEMERLYYPTLTTLTI